MANAASGSSEQFMLPRLLIIDHHDSYTHNLLISLLDAFVQDNEVDANDRKALSETLLSRTLILPHTDALWQEEKVARTRLLPHFDAVILGPGPGRPDVEKDFGASKRFLERMINDENGETIPTLGVCLGHQGIAVATGGALRPARYLRHGMTSSLTVSDRSCRWPSILDGLKTSTSVTTYNSLVINESTLHENIVVTATANDGPIDGQQPSSATDRVVMAVQHRMLPLWGLQFHPESIASEGGAAMMRNFLNVCRSYWRMQNDSDLRLRARKDDMSIPHFLRVRGGNLTAHATIGLRSAPTPPKAHRLHVIARRVGKVRREQTADVFRIAFQKSAEDRSRPVVWLDSARSGGVHSRFSFMAKPSWQLRYEKGLKALTLEANKFSVVLQERFVSTVGEREVEDRHGLLTPKPSRTNSPELESESSGMRTQTFFLRFDRIQKSIQRHVEYDDAARAVPYGSGFVGYMGYELNDESLAASKRLRQRPIQSSNFPSAWFGFCDQVLAFDHETDECFAIGTIDTRPNESWEDEVLDGLTNAFSEVDVRIGVSEQHFAAWTDEVRQRIEEVQASAEVITTHTASPLPTLTPRDTAEQYQAKVQRARQLIAQGESYEICLTTKFTGTMRKEQAEDPLSVYEALRRKNPAPFAAFMRLTQDVSICCSSLEKFIGIDRHGVAEMKPIKGTLARAGFGVGEADVLTRMRRGDVEATAWAQKEDDRRRTALQCDAKERAENLMIVDLIRRDLLSFCAPESVEVPTLMGTETYETVHQLVTTVRGRTADGVGAVAALSRCFPPGSMTGAPKVRSVELLEMLEGGNERGVYSGTLGWIGLDGAANFNVIIRSVCLDGNNVSVGAGGAITYHSKPEREWQEVLDKVGAIASSVKV